MIPQKRDTTTQPRDTSLSAARSAGFTLIELLVVIAIIGLLASLAAPALQRALDSGKGAACLSNLHQIGVAFMSYGSDHQMVLPGSTSDSKTDPVWARALASYIKVDPSKLKTIFVCPGCKIPVQLGSATDVAITYGMHIGLRGADLASDVARPSDTILCADTCQDPGNRGWSPNLIEKPSQFNGSSGRGGGGSLDQPIPIEKNDDKGNNPSMRYRHNDAVNVVMCDGRATSFKLKGSGSTRTNSVLNLNVLLQ